MNITIKVPFGEMTFDLPASEVMQFIQRAALGSEQPGDGPPMETKAAPTPDLPRPSKERTRTESLFGDKNTWNTPLAGSPANHQESQEEYKGFLLIECEECGKIKGFCAKSPISSHRCECGHSTDLHDLKPVYLECKCGSTYKYKTNIQAEVFSYSCLNCGAPVDLELNSRGTAFVTMSQED